MKRKVKNRLLVENNRLKCEITRLKLKVKKINAEKVILMRDKKKILKLYTATNVNGNLDIEEMRKNYTNKASCGIPAYDSYADILDKTTLDKLRKIKHGKRNDSTFVLNCMRGLYKNVQDLRYVHLIT